MKENKIPYGFCVKAISKLLAGLTLPGRYQTQAEP